MIEALESRLVRILAIAWLDGPESRPNIAATAITTTFAALLLLAGVGRNLRTSFPNKHPVRASILVGR
jgi:hypothetical protein